MSVMTTLKPLILESKDGEWGKDEPTKDSIEMKVIRGTDFEEVRLGIWNNIPIRFIPLTIAKRKRLQPQDILIETAGGAKNRSTGRSLLIKSSTISSSNYPLTCASFSRFIRINPKIANPGYIYWVLQYLHKSGLMSQYNTQHTGLSRFQFTIFSEAEQFPLPQYHTQQKIAAILSAYDDLIENNTRRIKILEEMAQAMYREWFVKFRFPGHEGVRMVESELGPVPEGWEVKKLGEVCLLIMGQSPSSEFYNETGEGLPFHQGVTNFGSRFPRDSVFCTIANRTAEDGDILFSVRAPVGRINLANKKIVIGRGLSAIRNKKGNQLFTYYQLLELFKEEDSIGGGTIFKSVTKDDMSNIRLLIPDINLIGFFEEFIKPISVQIDNLIYQESNLRRTRDLLLPRLISGEIDVSDIDIKIPEAVI